MKPAIRVENLSKCYRIGANRNGEYRTLRESLAEAASAPWRRFRELSRWGAACEDGSTNDDLEHVWALKDVSFEVEPGEVVGIIGRNGAGKSTLLKILSRITEPTHGFAEFRGRIGSLLEVGTGFHPELTGRENIYLNGSILGMTRREVARKFDEIVAFSEIEKFLDTPVKRYSSGMYVRLAFAVAAHLEPEILIVDEVLAVGDAAFQEKCLGRMRSIRQAGRTVLFVSHNMGAVQSLCTKAVLLENGKITGNGDLATVISRYRDTMSRASEEGRYPAKPGQTRTWIHSAQLVDERDEPTTSVPVGGCFRIEIELDAISEISHPVLGIGFDNVSSERVLTALSPLGRHRLPSLNGRVCVVCQIDPFPLAPGSYWLKLALSQGTHELESIPTAFRVTVLDDELFGEGRGYHRGICVAPATWHLGASNHAVR